MSTPLQTLARSSVPLLLTGPHALQAHGCSIDLSESECECAIAAESEPLMNEHFARNQWNVVYRTPFFAKFRLLSTGTPVIKVLFLDPTTFGQLQGASTEHDFGAGTMSVPSLIHVIAMKLQSIAHDINNDVEDLSEILALLRVNRGQWNDEELDAICKRFGPKGVYGRLAQNLAV